MLAGCAGSDGRRQTEGVAVCSVYLPAREVVSGDALSMACDQPGSGYGWVWASDRGSYPGDDARFYGTIGGFVYVAEGCWCGSIELERWYLSGGLGVRFSGDVGGCWLASYPMASGACAALRYGGVGVGASRCDAVCEGSGGTR